MKAWLHQLMHGDHGILLMLGCVGFIASTMIHVIHNQQFDPQSYGIGFGAILGGGGIGMGMKAGGERFGSDKRGNDNG